MTKEQERNELHRTIWQIANDLRGSVDGWDFKAYVLGMLFYRFISENLTAYLNRAEHEAGNAEFDYAGISDEMAEFGRAETVREKGFYILPSELFVNVRARAKEDPNLNETLSRVFQNIENSAKGAASEDDLKGLFDDIDVNSNKLGPTVAKRNELLVKILNAIGDLRLGTFTDNTIDAFGDAYEFLMSMYASAAGKSGGEFFTPQEVSELLARIAVAGKREVNKVYDPACGSGSLLLKFAKVLGEENVRQGFFGQEINLTTYNLCRINMFLHNINYERFDIAHGDTLTDPRHWDEEPFDAIVSNPPYSIRWAGDSNPLLINDPRFSPAGVLAPKSKADLAFTMHMLSWLSTAGTAAIVEFPGVLYRGGEDPEIFAGEQLCRHGDPAAAGSFFRDDDCDLHHRAEEEQARQQRALHRRLGGVRAGGEQEQALGSESGEDFRSVRQTGGGGALHPAGEECGLDCERRQPLGFQLRRAGGRPGGDRHSRAEPADRRNRRPPERTAHRHRRDRCGFGGETMKYVAQISQNILWTVAQRNGLTEHNRPVLLKKHVFLSNTSSICLKTSNLEAISQGNIA